MEITPNSLEGSQLPASADFHLHLRDRAMMETVCLPLVLPHEVVSV